MAFGGMVRSGWDRGPESARHIASGKPWLCSDWNCPARVSCDRHFGRSEYYAEMARKHPMTAFPDRAADEDYCGHYEYAPARDWEG
ncbi:hypothetical protein ACSMXM_01260 [Pacificimonas sp. ICDLI1SI03]